MTTQTQSSLEQLLPAAGAATDGALSRYCRAMARLDGPALESCFASTGSYSSFFVYAHSKPAPPVRGAPQPVTTDVLSVGPLLPLLLLLLLLLLPAVSKPVGRTLSPGPHHLSLVLHV